MKVVMVGQGAFGQKHLDGLRKIDGIEVVSLAGGRPESVEAVAMKYGIAHWTSDLAEALEQPGVDAAIIASPTQMHADQAVQVMRAGKHVEVEIPIADSLAEAQKIAKELRDWVGKEIGAIAKPKDIRFGDNLPKTRSGKIMRRLLRAIAKGEDITQDVSTLENPAILEQLAQKQ